MSSKRRTAPLQGGRNGSRRAVKRPAEPIGPTGSSLQILLVPAGMTVALLSISLLPRVQENPALARSFWLAAAALLFWQVILFLRLRSESATRTLTTTFRKQHYIQGLVQVSVFLYWGYYWRPVYDYFWLLLAQLAFAYAFDMLLSWSRRENYVLGFGPFPIIFSTNLFIWFRDDWFYLQFLMVAVGFLGKEFVKWHREGRLTHIFNPSAFSLGLFSLALIATGTTHLTWGPEIAATLTLAPNIYLFLFLTGLVVMYFFSITLVAGAAAATLFGLSGLYYAITGVPYFLDSEIPAAVFLGLHLLITDPSTSPRAPPGKALFGVGYGVGVFGLYAVLGMFGVPTFYDKLLCVPILNLSVRWIDGKVAALRERGALDRLQTGWVPARLNLVHMAIWIVLFGAMAMTGRTDGRHVGDSLPFWEQACVEGKRNACERLVQLEEAYCADNSGWACNELGRHHAAGLIVPVESERATAYFSRACELRFQAGCLNLLDEGSLAAAPPRDLDLRLLLREGGLNLLDLPERELYDRACDHAWSFACERVARAF